MPPALPSRPHVDRAPRLAPGGHPHLRAQGTLDGWHWLHLSRLPRVELAEARPTLSDADRVSLSGQLGEALGVLHRLSAPPVAPVLDWSAWLAERVPTLVESQRAKNCPEGVLDRLDAMMNGADLRSGRTGWLHTEVMREHLLVERTDRGWRLSGLFDFEPSWVGPVDYEFASLGLFFSAGDPALLDAVCRGAGVDPEATALAVIWAALQADGAMGAVALTSVPSMVFLGLALGWAPAPARSWRGV